MSAEFSAIVHVGAAKCGSSTLQHALSMKPDFAGRDGTAYSYVGASEGYGVLEGEVLRRAASWSSQRYVSTPNVFGDLSSLRWVDPLRARLAAIRAAGRVPIVSSEGWFHRHAELSALGFFDDPIKGAHVVVFVRPPVEWVNSAWWQWSIWSGATLDRAVAAHSRLTRWPLHIDQWRKMRGVAKLTVRLATQDVVPQFFDLLDVDFPQTGRLNTGVPPALLHFFLRNRRFRESAHASSNEFVAARHLRARGATPWSLTPAHVRSVLKETAQVPKNLARYLAPDDHARLMADPRWADPAPFDCRNLDHADLHTSPSALEQLYDVVAAASPTTATRRRVDLMAIRTVPRSRCVEIADPLIARRFDRLIAYDRTQTLLGA